jgi:hypothetical protein
MVKIKQKKTMNLPQLIEWAWDNEIKNKRYRRSDSNPYEYVWINENSDIELDEDMRISKHDTFTVEEEIEIDEYTVFHTLVKVIEDGTVYTCTDATINREKNSAVVEIHAILNGVLKLIWTHDKGLVE